MRSLERVTRIDDVLSGAQNRSFTAALARVERGGVLVYERAVGETRLDANTQAVYVDTRFDLASITKLFVATIALDLVARGVIDLDTTLCAYLPEWEGTEHARITPRMLLAHTSGMHSGADYRTLLDTQVADFALRRPLAARPGERVNLQRSWNDRAGRRDRTDHAAIAFGIERAALGFAGRVQPARSRTRRDSGDGRRSLARPRAGQRARRKGALDEWHRRARRPLRERRRRRRADRDLPRRRADARRRPLSGIGT